MKKVYCDRCGKEMEQNDNILLRKTDNHGNIHTEDYFDICPACRDAFFGWLNGAPAEQEKPVKVADKPAKQEANKADKPAEKTAKTSKSKKDKSAGAYTVSNIAFLSEAPESTVRRHLQGLCPSTYGHDKQGRTIRYYHLTDEQLDAVVERIKGRKQGRRINI
jgi:hypothetical protein